MENRLKSSLPVPWRSQVRSLQARRPCLVLEFDLALFWKPFLSLLSCQPPSVCALCIPSARLRGVLCWRISSRCSSWPQGGESAWDWVMHWESPCEAPASPACPWGWAGEAGLRGRSPDVPHEFWQFSHKTTQTWTKCTSPTQSWCFSETVCQGFKEKKKRKIHRHMEQQRGGENTHRQPVTMFRQIFRLFIWKNDVSFIYTFKIWLEDIISQCFPPSIFSNARLKKVSIVTSC